MDFIAIDFETANNNRSSACAMGLAYVENGILVASESYLIKPVPNYFEPRNINIHGITPAMVKDSPGFDVLWSTIAPKIMGQQLVAHYAPFDMDVFKKTLLYYSIALPFIDNYYCSYRFAKQIVNGLENYKLSTVCDYFDIPLNHHEAESDARGAALIMLQLMEINNVATLSDLSTLLDFKTGKSNRSRSHNFNPNNIQPDTTEFDEDHFFYKQCVVFTGTLSSFRREDAAQKVVNAGGIVKNSLVNTTNYLVVGSIEFNKPDFRQTEKYLKAKELINTGADLEIISEDDFLDYLNPSFTLTNKIIEEHSQQLEEKNPINEFYSKTVYFSQGFENPYDVMQLAGNLGAAAHNCWELNEAPMTDYFIISKKEFDCLINGEKSESVLKVESAINKKLKGDPDIKCITEEAFYSYLNRRNK
jgi:DNA polymerase-3 subunit epsilon